MVLTTERLRLARLQPDDAAFIHALVNDPDWLAHIGDRGVRTLEDARAFIANGPAAMYARLGHGLYRVDRLSDDMPIGLCGLLKRDTLADIDIGYAFLPAYRGQGYALEAAQAVIVEARERVGAARVLAITSPGNLASARLLEKLGMRQQGRMLLAADGDEVCLWALDLA